MKTRLHLLQGNFLLYMWAGLTLLLSGCDKYKSDPNILEGLYLFNGQVLEAGSGSPVKGATVVAYADQSTIETERRTDDAIGKTDSKGRFSMKVSCDPFDTYEYPFFCFYVEHPDYQAADKGFYYSSGVKIYLTRIK